MTYFEEILKSEDKYFSALDKMGYYEKKNHHSFLKWLTNDFKNISLMFFKLKDLMTACNKISEMSDIDSVFEGFSQEICNFLTCDKGEIYLFDEATKELWTTNKKNKSEIIKIQANKGIFGYVVRTSNPLKIDEAYSDPRFDKQSDQINNYRTKTILCVPIKDSNSDKVIGIAYAVNKLGEKIFSFDDEGIMNILAKQAGTILSNTIYTNKMTKEYSKTKRIISIGNKCYAAKSIKDLQRTAEMYLEDLMSVKKVAIWFVNPESRKMYRHEDVSKKNTARSEKINIGLVG